MGIKFGELRITNLARQHIEDCLNNNHVTMGPKTELFEQKWSETIGVKHTIGVNSGTSAVTSLCMLAYDLKNAEPGDEIIVPALSFIASANAIRSAGLTPVFCDVKLDSMIIDLNQIEKLITPKTRAILPVSLMGKPFNGEYLRKIADKYNLLLLGDCCESHGCKFKGKNLEDYCDATAYSGYIAHVLSAGEMGWVSTNYGAISDIVRSVRSHGRHPGHTFFNHVRYGLNFKPNDLTYSVALGVIDDFWKTFNIRKRNLKTLQYELGKLRNIAYFTEEDENEVVSPHAFSVTLKEKNDNLISKFTTTLNRQDIEWKRNFGCIPEHGAYRYLKPKEFPNSSHCGDYGFHIGVHSQLSEIDIKYIVSVLGSVT